MLATFTTSPRVREAARLALVVLFIGIAPPASRAAIISVDTLDDELNTDGDCSLREAIESANTDTAVDGCVAGSGADNIRLPAGTITLSVAGAGEDLNQTGDLDITTDVDIQPGAPTGTATIDGGSIDRVLDISNGATVTISRVIVQNGAITVGDGGGIRSQSATLSLTEVAVRTSSADCNSGGGIYHFATAATHTFTMTKSEVSGNTAGFGGGVAFVGNGSGVGFAATAVNSTLSGNAIGNSCATPFGSSVLIDQSAGSFDNVTVGNTDASASVFQVGTTSFAYRNSILDGNVVTTNSATLTSNDFNLLNGTGWVTNTNDVSAAPNLAALADNGGNTQTMAPNLGSGALGAGSCTDSSSVAITEDQTGSPRTTSCDIGAFEGKCETTAECTPDSNDCTDDQCVPATGCEAPFSANGTSCDDADLTTANDVCDGAGACAGTTITCPAVTTCATAWVENGTDCTGTFAANGTSCDDSDLTTANDVCDGAGACAGTTITCPSTTDCIVSYTENGVDCTPTFAANMTVCDDGDLTTASDMCDGAGVCAGTTITCPSTTTCTPSYTENGVGCDPNHAAINTACDDGDAGTSNDVCDGAGTCAGSGISCPATTTCTPTYTPNGSGCDPTHAAAATPCDDSDLTTANDQCDGAGTCAGTTITCPSTTECITAYTENGTDCTPTFASNGTACTDGDSFVCTSGECDGAGACSAVSLANGTGCDDSDACTINDVCDGTTTCAGSDLCFGTGSGTTCNTGVCTCGSGLFGSLCQLQVSETSGNSVTAGGTWDIPITALNLDSANVLTNVKATLTLSSDLTFNSANGVGVNCTPSGSTVSCDFGNIGASLDEAVTITVDVAPTATGAVSVDIVGAIDGTQGTANAITASASAGVDINVSATLAAAHASGGDLDNDGAFQPGETLEYTAVVTNDGSSTAVGTSFKLTLDSNVTIVANSVQIDGSGTGSSVSNLSVGDIGGNSSVTVTFQAIITNPFPITATQVSNQATISGAAFTDFLTDDPSVGGASDATVTTVDAAPDLKVTKTTAQSDVVGGTVVTYTIQYENCGTQAASGVVITETVPQGTTFKTDAATTWTGCSDGEAEGSTCTFAHVGDLAPDCGNPETLTFVVTLAAVLDGTDTGLFPGQATCATGCVQNTVSIADDGANGTDLNTADNTLLLREPTLQAAPDVQLSVVADVSEAKNSDLITYTITYGNIGTQDASNITFQAVVPASTTHDPNASDFSCATGVAGDTCTLSLASLTQGTTGQTAVFVVRVSDTLTKDVTQLDTTITASQAVTELRTDNNSQSVSIPVRAAPDLIVSKAHTDGNATPGLVVNYQITYTNQGTLASSGVVITETVPDNATHKPQNGDTVWTCGGTQINEGGSAVAGTTCTYTDPSSLPFTDDGSNQRTINFRVTLDDPLPGSAQITNNVSIEDSAAANPSELDESNNTDTDITDSVAAPNLAVTLDANATEATVSSVITYTIDYSNDGTETAYGTVITETVPDNTTYTGSNGWVCVGSTCTISVGDLVQGATGSVEFQVTVDSTLSAAIDNISNTVSIDDDATDPNHVVELVLDNNTASLNVPVRDEADLQIAIVSVIDGGGSEAAPGDGITYTLNYSNAGNQTAFNTLITETIPDNTTFVSSGSSAFQCLQGITGGLPCTLNIGNINAGTSGSVTFKVQVIATLPQNASSIDNAVSIDAGVDLNTTDNSASDTINIAQAPDAAIVSVLDDANALGVSAGDTIQYTISYDNLGSSTATDVDLVVTVPNNTTFNSTLSTTNSGSWNCSNGTCTLAVGPLAPNAAPNAVVFAVDVDNPLAAISSVAGNISIVINGGVGFELDSGNNSFAIDTLVRPAPDLQMLTPDGPSEVTVGDIAVYTLNYDNLGTATATGVTLSETVPANTTFEDFPASDIGWSCAAGGVAGDTCTYTVGSLPVNDPRSTRFAVTVASTLTKNDIEISNTASVVPGGGNAPELDDSNNSQTITTPVTAGPDLIVGLGADASTATVSQTIQYTVTYENDGRADATGVSLSIVEPTNTTYTAGVDTFAHDNSSAAWNCSGGTCTLSVGDLPLGTAQRTVTFTVEVAADLSGVTDPISSSVTASGNEDAQDLNSGNNTATLDLPIATAPDLTMAVSANLSIVATGGTVTYTGSYSNNSDEAASGTTVTACLPSIATAATSGNTSWVCSTPDGNPVTCPFTTPTSPSAYDTYQTCTTSIGAVAGNSGPFTVALVVDVSNQLTAAIDTIPVSMNIDNAGGTDLNPSNNIARDDVTVAPGPHLTLTNETPTLQAEISTDIVYTLTAENIGTATASGVVLTETVPNNTTLDPASNSGWSCDPLNGSGLAEPGATCTQQLGTLFPGGGPKVATFTVTTDATLQGVANISNTASVVDNGLNGDDLNVGGTDNIATAVVQAAPSPDLVLTLSADKTDVNAGESVTYTLSYSNVGTFNGQNSVITLCVPDNTLSDASNIGNGFTCQVPTVGDCPLECSVVIPLITNDGAVNTVDFVANVLSALPDAVTSTTLTATIVDGISFDLDDSNNTPEPLTVNLVAAPDLQVSYQTSPASGIPGGSLSFLIQYENAGSQVARNVVITETLPPNTNLDADNSPDWTCIDGNCTFTVDTVSVDGPKTVPFVVTVQNPLAATVTSTSASVTIADDVANGADLNAADNSASIAEIPLTAAAANAISVSAVPSPASAGGALTYEIKYWNAGNQDARDVVLNAQIDSLVTVDAAASTPSGWVCNVNAVTSVTECSVTISGDVAGGGTVDSAATATVAGTLIDELEAGTSGTSGVFTISDDIDPGVTDASESLTVPIDAAPNLQVTQAVTIGNNLPAGAPGETITFAQNVRNIGNQIATGVTLTNVVPSNTVFEDELSSAWVCCATPPCDGSNPSFTAGSTCTLSLGTIDLSAQPVPVAPTFIVRVVNPLDAGVVDMSNTVTISDDGANGSDADLADNTSTELVLIDANPDLTVTLADQGLTRSPGDTIVYTVSAQNVGDQHATGVTLSMDLPTNTTYDPNQSSSAWACVENLGTTTCTIDYATFQAGTPNPDVFLGAKIDSPLADGVTEILGTASIVDDGANHKDGVLNVTSNTVTTAVEAATGLTVSFDSATVSQTPGGQADYTVRYSNAGNQNASGVTLVVEVPTNAAFDEAASNALLNDGSSWSCNDATTPATCSLLVGVVPVGIDGNDTRSFVLELDTLSTSLANGGSDTVEVRVDITHDLTNGEAAGENFATTNTDIARCGFDWRFETSGQEFTTTVQAPLFEYVNNGVLGGGYWRTGGDNLLEDTAEGKLQHLNVTLDIPSTDEGGLAPQIEVVFQLSGEANPTKDIFGLCVAAPSDTGQPSFTCNKTNAPYSTGTNTPNSNLDDTENGIRVFNDGTYDHVVVDVTAFAGAQVELSMFYQTTGTNDVNQGVAILEIRQYSDADNDDSLDGRAALCDVCWDVDNDGFANSASPAFVTPSLYSPAKDCVTAENPDNTPDCKDDSVFLNVDCSEDCADFIDNNEDGLADCDDTECASDPFCDVCETTFTFDTGSGAWVNGGTLAEFGYRQNSEDGSGWRLLTPDLSTGGKTFNAYIFRNVNVDAGMPEPEVLVTFKLNGAIEGVDRFGVCVGVNSVTNCIQSEFAYESSSDTGNGFITARISAKSFSGQSTRVQVFFSRSQLSDQAVSLFVSEVSVLSDIDQDGLNGDPNPNDGLSPYENSDATCDKCLDRDGDGFGDASNAFNDPTTCPDGKIEPDCNDDPDAGGASVNPGVDDITECSIAGDQNCDGLEDSEYANCSVCGDGYVTAGEECDDGTICDPLALAEGQSCPTPVPLDGDGCSSTCQLEDSGQVYISEIHLAQFDSNQQWFEIYNATDAVIDPVLMGLTISNQFQSMPITDCVLATTLIPSRGYYVISLGTQGQTGDLTADAYCKGPILLNDTGDRIILRDVDGQLETVVDTVDFLGTDFSCERQFAVDTTNGKVRSIELVGPDTSSASLNDTPESWCVSREGLPQANGQPSSVNFGSPGGAGTCGELFCDGNDDDCDGSTDEVNDITDPDLPDADGDFVCDDPNSEIDCDPNTALCNVDCFTDEDADGVPDCKDGCLDSDGDGYGTPGNNPDRELQCTGCRNPQAECLFCSDPANVDNPLCEVCADPTTLDSRCLADCSSLPTISCPGVTCTNEQVVCQNCKINPEAAECAICATDPGSSTACASDCSTVPGQQCETVTCDSAKTWCDYCKIEAAKETGGDPKCDICKTDPASAPLLCAADCTSVADTCSSVVCSNPKADCQFCAQEINKTSPECVECLLNGATALKCSASCDALPTRLCDTDTCLATSQTCDCNDGPNGANVNHGGLEGVTGSDVGSCTDSFDNDCDGLPDCSDPDCSSSADCQGSTCDSALPLYCGTTRTVTPVSADLPCNSTGLDSVLNFTANATEFQATGTGTVTVRVVNNGNKAFGTWLFAPDETGKPVCPTSAGCAEAIDAAPGLCQQTRELDLVVEANKTYSVVVDETIDNCGSAVSPFVEVTVICQEDCIASGNAAAGISGDEDADGFTNCADLDCIDHPSCLEDDFDGDGVSNLAETTCGSDPELAQDTPTTEDLSDTDGDGLLNCVDLDDDGDSLSDLLEVKLGTDKLVFDTDGDGLSDGQEDANGDGVYQPDTETSPLVADTDADELSDGLEVTSCYDLVLDTTTCRVTDALLEDTDGDGLPDGQEDLNKNGKVDLGETNPTVSDSDGDGYSDGQEVTCNTDPLDGKKVPTFILDATECDGLKIDTDNDGVADGVETLCGTDFEDPNNLPGPAALKDTDGDGLVDCVDPDDDDDAVPDVFEEICGTDPTNDESKPPLIDVLDTDGDGFRNCQDADDDGDGVVDADESKIGTNQYDADSDDDGLFDGAERDSHLTDPTVFDSDGDGLSDGLELGMTEAKLVASSLGGDTDRFVFVPDACPETKTDPTRADTDDDGLSDGEEDSNKDGCVTLCEINPDTGVKVDSACTDEFDPNDQNDVEFDADGDGLSDLSEVQIYNTDPTRADTDNDLLSDGGEVKVYKTDPLVADTDGGGVNDGDEVNNQTNPLDPDDDFSIGRLASGSESSCGVGESQDLTPLWILLGAMAVLAWRRRTGGAFWLVILLCAGTLFVPRAAEAQTTRVDAVNIFSYTPVGGQYRHWSVEQSIISPHLQPYASVMFHLENDSLTLVTGNSTENLVDFAVFADLNIGIGLYDWVSLEIGLPVALELRSGSGVQSVAVQNGAGLGDMVVRIRTRLLSNRSGGAGLALTTGVTIPTGDGAAFRGDEGFGILAGLIADFKTQRTVTSLNVGARIRTVSSRFFDTIIDHDLNFGLGFDAIVWRNWVTIGSEIFGRTALTDPFGTKENTSLEFLVGPKINIFEGFSWQMAVGAGLVRGRGTPQYRFVSGFVYAPRIQDSDGDGIAERDDLCPLEKEDKDDFRDGDGCPDHDNDGDGIDDIADRCPATPEDSNGVESSDGCPDSDQDADGIVDVHDRCPYNAEDHDGFQDDDGCPERDNDADSILDVYDACPNVAETYNGMQDDDGCPDATPRVAALPCSPKCSFQVQNVLRFPEKDARLTTVHRRFLDELAERILQNEYISEVKITGYAWDEGERDEAKKLARDRAGKAMKYLESRGVPGVLLTTYDIFHDASMKAPEPDKRTLRPAERELTPEQRRYRAANRENAAEMRRVTFKVVMSSKCGTGRVGPACGRTQPDPEMPRPPIRN